MRFVQALKRCSLCIFNLTVQRRRQAFWLSFYVPHFQVKEESLLHTLVEHTPYHLSVAENKTSDTWWLQMTWAFCSVQVCSLRRARRGRLSSTVWCCLRQHSWESVGLSSWLCLRFPEVMPPISGKLSWSCGSWSSGLGLLELLSSVVVDFVSEHPRATVGTSVPSFLFFFGVAFNDLA